MSGPPPNPRRGRQRHLVRALDGAAALVAVLSIAALIAPGDVGEVLAWAVVAMVIAVPLLRVAWLAVRWARLGDHRFAAVAVVLLAIVGGGSLLAG